MMKIVFRKYYFNLILVLLLPSIASASNITVSTNVLVNTNWTADTIFIGSNISIQNGITLTIKPGRVVLLKGHYSILCDGMLNAKGKQDSLIQFNIQDTTGFSNYFSNTGSWAGIRFISVNQADSSIFKYCSFQYSKVRGITLPENSNGGAIYISSSSKIAIRNCIFYRNMSNDDGGALYVNNTAIRISGCTFRDNYSKGSGGALKIINSNNSIIEFCTFEKNFSGNANGGGACDTYGSGMAYLNCTFYNNASSWNGGALIHSNAAVLIKSCEFRNNKTSLTGGAIYLTTAANSSLINCLFANNEALDAGALYSDAVTANIINSTFVNNSAISAQKGFYIIGSPTVKNCIIWNSVCYSTGVTSYSYSDVQGIGGGTNLNINPQFILPSIGNGNQADALTSNWALKPISPCINRGNSDTSGYQLPVIDLNKLTRIAKDTVDMGAYEFQHIPSLNLLISNDTICQGSIALIKIKNTEQGVQYRLKDDLSGLYVNSIKNGTRSDIIFRQEVPSTRTYTIESFFSKITRYEAEANSSNSGITYADWTSYTTGTGGLQMGTGVGTWGEWNYVNGQGDGTRTLILRYACDELVNAPHTLFVNGILIKNIDFATTGNTFVFDTIHVTINLNAGLNTIRLTSTSTRKVMLDHFLIINSTSPDIYTQQQKASILVKSAPNNTSSLIGDTICSSGIANVYLNASISGVNYFLRNIEYDSIIAGPIAGNGNKIDFNINVKTNQNYTAIATYGNITKIRTTEYGAEIANFYPDSAFDNYHCNYSDTGYAELFSYGAWLEWNQILGEGYGEHTLYFPFKNQDLQLDNRPCNVFVNDKYAGTISFPTTGTSGCNWDTSSINVNLNKGYNKIRLSVATNFGGPVIDKMIVKNNSSVLSCATAINDSATVILSTPAEIKLSSNAPICNGNTLYLFENAETASDTAYLNWPLKTKIKLNTSTTGANISQNIYSIPILVQLTPNNFNDFNNTMSNGADIRFAKANGTHLNYEIERWTNLLSNKDTATIWVLLDTVFGNNDAQYIIMYYGNKLATSVSNGTNVFNSSNGYAGVWHFNDNFLDATNNANNGTNVNTTSSLGMIGRGRTIGNNNYIEVAHNNSLNATTEFTLSAWIKPKNLAANPFMGIINKGLSTYANYNLETKLTQAEVDFFDGTIGLESIGGTLTNNNWYYISGIFNTNGDSLVVYVNGVLANKTTTTSNLTTNSDKLYIGTNDIASMFLDGSLDEVIVSKTARTSSWIKLNYENQKANQKLVSIGSNINKANSWLWSGPNSFTSNLQNPTIATADTNASGNYKITVTNTMGCTSTASKNINVREVPKATIILGNDTICSNDTAIITISFTGEGPWRFIHAINGINQAEIITDQNPYLLHTTTTSTYTISSVSNAYDLNQILYLPSNTDSITALKDVSGTGFVAKNRSSKWELGSGYQKTDAYYFNNSDLVIADTSIYDISGTVSVAAWIKPIALGATFPRIISKSHTSNAPPYTMYGLILNKKGTYYTLRFELTTGGIQYYINGNIPIPFLNWTHIAATYDGTKISLYNNGILDTILAHTGSIDTNIQHVSIGSDGLSDSYFNGYIDEMMIYNRSLSAKEISNLYHGPLLCTNTGSGSAIISYKTNTAAILRDTSVCDSFTISAQGSFSTYQWYNGSGKINGANKSKLHINTTGNYYVITDSATCCDTSNSVLITINKNTLAPTLASGSACDTLSLNAGIGHTSQQWYASGSIISGANTRSYLCNTSNTNTVIVTDINGCKDTSNTANITINKYTSAPVFSSLSICDTLSLNAGSGHASQQWYNSSGLLASYNNPKYLVQLPDDYYVIVTGINTCRDTSNLASININSAGIAPILSNQNFCTSGILHAGTGLANYQWYNSSGIIIGATDSNYTATSNNTYFVALEDVTGCKDSSNVITINILTPPTTAMIVSDTVICAFINIAIRIKNTEVTAMYRLRNDNTMLYEGLATAGNGATITIIVTPTTSTNYTVITAVNDSFCKASVTDNAILIALAEPDADLPLYTAEVTSTNTCKLIFNNASPSTQYHLQSSRIGDTISDVLVAKNNTISFENMPLSIENTIIWLIAKNQNACIASDSVLIGAIERDIPVDISNVITPNNDGKNDKWIIKNSEVYPNIKIIIFDRWGRTVYTFNGLYDNNQNAWDGRDLNEKELPVDSYHYILDLGIGKKNLLGNITIIK